MIRVNKAKSPEQSAVYYHDTSRKKCIFCLTLTISNSNFNLLSVRSIVKL